MKGQAKSGAAMLLESVRHAVSLFRTPSKEPFVSVRANPRQYGTYGIWSPEFEEWLRLYAERKFGEPPDAEVINKVTSQLAAQARQNEREHRVFTRIAHHVDGQITIDLGRDNNDAVYVTETGWSIVHTHPISFRRTNNTSALPHPAQDGDIGLLRPFLNVATEDDWILFVALIIGALYGKGPFASLVMFAEQGSAKTTTSELFKTLVDPVKRAVTLSPPRDARDLAIMAQNNYILAFDNISNLPAWLSDALCRLATGGGFVTRELYTNAGEVIFDAQRSVCLNGITEFAERGDLLDRSIVLPLPAIPEEQRKRIQDYWQDFDAVWPRIFAGLLDAVAVGLKNRHNVKLERRPRMADFAEWVVACEPALPWPPGAFLEAYERNRGHAVQVALDASPIAQSIIAFVEQREYWEGNATELLADIKVSNGIASDYNPYGWPRDARALSAALDRIAPALRKVGVEVTKPPRTAASRVIVLKWAGVANAENIKTAAAAKSSAE
jgi:hypothetical protein